MNILVILAHPSEKSFNHEIALTVVNTLITNEHQVIFHDLNKEKFDPILVDEEIPKNAKIPEFLETYCRETRDADGIFIVHPNWWGMPPAILKGWIDRVFRPGSAYMFKDQDNGEGIPIGLLKANAGIVFNTSNTGEERENEFFKDPLETIWKNCIFDLCGVKKFYRKMFRIMVTSSFEQRQEWLVEVAKVTDQYFPKY